MTRGDTAYLKVNVEKLNGDSKESYTIKSTDTLTLTVKDEKELDKQPLLQKTVTGTATIGLVPIDTKAIAFGKYVYDIQLTTSGGEVYTIVPHAHFIVDKEVG